MEPKVKNLDYDRVKTVVEFDQVEKSVICTKSYHSDETTTPIHMETITYNLRTMPLSVALQLACGYVQQVGLVDYE